MATRVLVVDDDPRILGLLRRGLGFAAYVVDAAADGEAALASARDRPPAEALFSTIGRVAARGVETVVLAEQLGGWVGQLEADMNAGKLAMGHGARIPGLGRRVDDHSRRPARRPGPGRST